MHRHRARRLEGQAGNVRIRITRDPYLDRGTSWPAKWISCADTGPAPFVTAYRKVFELEKAASLTVHVSADERYELYLDGERVGRGSERGDPDHWYFETYLLRLSAGRHVFVAKVWSMGAKRPYAQFSVFPGFLFSPEETPMIALLGTGVAEWEAMKLPGFSFSGRDDPTWRTGAKLTIDAGQYAWGFEAGAGDAWQACRVHPQAVNAWHQSGRIPSGRVLLPAALPVSVSERYRKGVVRFAAFVSGVACQRTPVRAQDASCELVCQWQHFIQHDIRLTVPGHSACRVIIDLEDYVCAYPELGTTGGRDATVRLYWAESLYVDPQSEEKGDRHAVEGKYFRGVGDVFKPDGGDGRIFRTLWWHAGRFLEITVTTEDEALVLDFLRLEETRYPLEMEARFYSDDPRLASFLDIAVRTVQMNAHETYMDCPYYEQLQYAGDTRTQALVTYVMTLDDRLPRKALVMLDASRQVSGLTQSRYPSHDRQIIPPFSLWWVCMVHDHAAWRGDRLFARGLMPGVRAVLDFFLAQMDGNGLVRSPRGWNYFDWVAAWDRGVPPAGVDGFSALLNWQTVLTLEKASALEAWLDEPALSRRYQGIADGIARRIMEAFWDDERQLFADDPDKQCFSEHTQSLAIISNQLDDAKRDMICRRMLASADLAVSSYYFSHYLFEALTRQRRMDALFDRLEDYLAFHDNGFKTTPETSEPTRSDCHGWGAHPLFHYFAGILGIRPASLGFEEVTIAPQPGPLKSLGGTLPHPKGSIVVHFECDDRKLSGSIALPMGVRGHLAYGCRRMVLHEGMQEISLP